MDNTRCFDTLEFHGRLLLFVGAGWLLEIDQKPVTGGA
jgi:hypothetical protein